MDAPDPAALFDLDFERGLRQRRALLGDAWVDAAAERADSFTADFQAFVTRVAWHEVWGRPGLDLRTRRVLVLVVPAALGRWDEFELHCRAALSGAGGATPDSALSADEVKEALLQLSIYAGVPAANTAVARTAKILRELGQVPAPQAAHQATHPGVGRRLRSAGAGGRAALHATVREARDMHVPGRPERATVVFAHALGADSMMWDPLANRLAARHRVVAVDLRGHGGSDVIDEPCSVDDLAADVEPLLDGLRLAPHEPLIWVGLSLGGMVGMALAARRPQRLQGLLLANTTAWYGAQGAALWHQRIATVQREGLAGIADATMARWFTPDFRAAQPSVVAQARRRLLSTDPRAYIACLHALAGLDLRARLAALDLPVEVIVARHDEGTPMAMGEALASGLKGARLTVIDDAAHLSVVEQGEAFAAVLGRLLQRVGPV